MPVGRDWRRPFVATPPGEYRAVAMTHANQVIDRKLGPMRC
jgi:hypothetical protein